MANRLRPGRTRRACSRVKWVTVSNVKPKKDRASDLVSAALRHVDDAEGLLSSSPDQSWHLAGFGPECARKACLRVQTFDKMLGHELAEMSERVLDVALVVDPNATRYAVRELTRRYPTLSRWRVESRYERTGTRSAEDAQSLVRESAQLTHELAAALWMDGRAKVLQP